MEYIVKYIECIYPSILPFERKQHGRNKKNYTIFILHYFEYYSNLSKDNKFGTKLDLLTTSDMESINQSDDESINDSDSDESGKDEDHELHGTYNAARKIWKELDFKYKDIFCKRCIIFNSTPRIGEFTTAEDLSYLDVVPS